MLNTVSSPLFKCVRRKTHLSTLKSRLNLDCPAAALYVRRMTPNHIHAKTLLIISSNCLGVLLRRYLQCHSLLENHENCYCTLPVSVEVSVELEIQGQGILNQLLPVYQLSNN